MKRYVFFLANSPTYPNEIYANSPQEVKKLIMESIPDPSQILKIVEVDKNASLESNKAVANHQNDFQEVDPDNFKNANDFFESIVNTAVKKSESLKKEEAPQQKVVDVKEEKPLPKQVPQQPQVANEEPIAPRFFEEAGIKFKLENGKIYKQSWIEVKNDESANFRFKNKKTNHLVDSEKFIVEKLEWVEI